MKLIIVWKVITPDSGTAVWRNYEDAKNCAYSYEYYGEQCSIYPWVMTEAKFNSLKEFQP